MVRGVAIAVVCFVAAASTVAMQAQGLPSTGGVALPPVPPDAPAVTSGGMINGRVVCDDTQRGARFVQVAAWPVASTTPRAAQTDGSPRNGPMRMARPMGGSTSTDLNGEFALGPLAPGDYVLQVYAPGYVTTGAQVRAQLAAGASADDVMARLPMAHVVGDGSSQVVITIERGGAVGGVVQWEDGSPAAGINMWAAPRADPPQAPETLRGFPMMNGPIAVNTDDRGHFRLSGLAPGEYLLRASTNMRSTMVPGRGFHMLSGSISVWAPGVMHKADAQPITVHQGDERDDIRLVLDFGRLHAVSGHVSGMQPGQALTGNVNLQDPKDSSFDRQGAVDSDGRFSVEFVPEGTYTLHVSVRPVETTAPQPPGRNRGSRGLVPAPQEQSANQTVTVGSTDLTGVVVAVGPGEAQEAGRP